VASRRSKRKILQVPLVTSFVPRDGQDDNPCPIVICDSAPRSFRKVGGYQNGRRGTPAAACAALSLVSRPTARFSAYLHNSNITVAEGYEETQQIFYVRICTGKSVLPQGLKVARLPLARSQTLRNRRKDSDCGCLRSFAAHCQKQAVKVGGKEARSRSLNGVDPR
jgi:hypothetical protein